MRNSILYFLTIFRFLPPSVVDLTSATGQSRETDGPTTAYGAGHNKLIIVRWWNKDIHKDVYTRGHPYNLFKRRCSNATRSEFFFTACD